MTDTIVRAFQLAPTCGSLEELRHKLKKEGFWNVDEHLSGKLIHKQLTELLDGKQVLQG